MPYWNRSRIVHSVNACHIGILGRFIVPKSRLFSQSYILAMFLLFLLFQVCRCSDTIIGNKESLKDANEDYLVSNTSKFVLGFFSPENSSNRYVGIWYSQTIVPDKTVVWVANRNNPINDSSGVLKINRYGELALYAYDLENDPRWFTNVSWSVQNVNASNLSAHLLDTGNLVVLQHDRNEKYLWQSFDHPTDNLLPGMKVGMNWKTGQKWDLTSWKSQNDPATGDYSMRLYPSQTESPEFFIYKGLSKYYRIDVSTPAVKMLVPIVTNEEETYFFLNTSEMKISAISDTVRSLTWDYGKLRWNEDFSAPKSRCDFYGKCGANSICSPDNLNQFECQCLRGYEPKSISDWNNRNGSGGCVSNQVGFSKCGDEDGFVPVERVKYPDTSIAALSKSGMSAKDCEQECLRNCSCTAYLIFGNEEVGDCLTWYDDLMDILVYAEGGQELHIRVNATLLAEYSGKSQGKVTPATLIVVAVLAMVLLTIMLGCWWRKKNRNTTEHSAGMELEETHRHPELQYFDLDTIIAATNDFSCINELGHGGFGSVYKGKLPNEQIVAVKRLSKTSGQGIKEFQNEVELIAKLQHRNLVKLFGCCIKGDERILVLEYMPNKSLDSFLFDPTKRSLLDWERRFGIINGIARGILYLHQDSRLRIIHRDLKTSNVLLDDEMNPKISDFGMARIFHGNQPQYRTNRIVGTYGYMSPEYAVFGKFSTKLDVFSFGIIMLEIVSGQKNNGSDLEDPSMNLIGHVWELWNEGRALDIIDPTLRSYQSNEVIRCLQVGLLCVQEDSKDRPSMSDVFIMLIGEASPPSPNQPAFVFRRSGADDEPLISNKSSVNDMTVTIMGAR